MTPSIIILYIDTPSKSTLNKAAYSKMAQLDTLHNSTQKMTISIMAFNKMTPSNVTLSIMNFIVSLS